MSDEDSVCGYCGGWDSYEDDDGVEHCSYCHRPRAATIPEKETTVSDTGQIT